jgi:hypothetical protein
LRRAPDEKIAVERRARAAPAGVHFNGHRLSVSVAELLSRHRSRFDELS